MDVPKDISSTQSNSAISSCLSCFSVGSNKYEKRFIYLTHIWMITWWLSCLRHYKVCHVCNLQLLVSFHPGNNPSTLASSPILKVFGTMGLFYEGLTHAEEVCGKRQIYSVGKW